MVGSIYSPPQIGRDHFDRDYVSGPDCQIYINSVYLDEVASLRYQVHNTRTITYGYHSEFADDIIEGNELVQGVIAIYLVQDNYIGRKIIGQEDKTAFQKTGLTEVQRIIDGGWAGVPDLARGLLEQQLGKAYIKSAEEIIEKSETDEPYRVDPITQIQLSQIRDTVGKVLNANMPRLLESIRQAPHNDTLTSTGRSVRPFKDKFNEFKQKEFSLGIVTGYNQPDTMFTTIEGCVLDANAQTIRTTAEPILSIYKFMGRKIREEIYNG
jgi:hypothetical protein